MSRFILPAIAAVMVGVKCGATVSAFVVATTAAPVAAGTCAVGALAAFTFLAARWGCEKITHMNAGVKLADTAEVLTARVDKVCKK